jgi:F-box/TPR repeat protein Pof3
MLKYDRCLHMLGEARRRMNPSDPSYPRKINEVAEMESAANEGLQAAETRRRSHVDPLKKLPLELLVEICKIAVESSDAETVPRGASHFAVVLGSVCRSLRAVIHQTPSLWQSVTLSEKRLARKSAFWLERLDGYPLYSVTLVDIGQQTRPQLLKILASTYPESWKSLRIEGNDSDAHPLFLALHACNLSLHSFSVECPPYTDGSLPLSHAFAPEEVLSDMAPVPETQNPGTYMRCLSLHVGYIDMRFITLPHVTHLEIGTNNMTSSQYGTLHHILHAAPGLRSLIFKPRNVFGGRLTYVLEPVPELEGTEPLRAEQLKVLRIGTLGPREPNPVILFPKLEVLEVQRMPVLGSNILLDYLLGVPPEDRPPIREIRLHHSTTTAARFKLILEAFTHTLESLDVANCGILDDDILESFSRPIKGTNDPLLCPRLRDINFSGTTDLTAGPLVRLIKARLPSSHVDNPDPPTPIRNLVIDSCPGVSAEALPWMRANVTGMLSCVYRSKSEAKGRKRDRHL